MEFAGIRNVGARDAREQTISQNQKINRNRLEDKDSGNDASVEIIRGDANALIQTIEDHSIDLIATDPPYEINFENNGWDKSNSLNWNFLAKEFLRVLKTDGSLVLFQGWSRVAETKRVLDQCFTLKNWIIYDRVKGRGAKTNVVSTREDILWYVVDENKYTFNKVSSVIKKKTKGMGARNGNEYRALSNVWSDVPPLVPWGKERVNHPTQKPLFLMDRIIRLYSNAGDAVLDPFLGSGTTALACKSLNRNCVGFELNSEYFKIAEDRIAACERRFI